MGENEKIYLRMKTAFSNYDIAWVRIGREKSGTQKNLDRRNNNGRV